MLYGVKELREKNIAFSILGEAEAARVMETEYGPRTLLSYVPLFPCYSAGERRGQAIDVDCAYLYDLAALDTELRKLVMAVCLDVEQSLRAVFLADCRQAGAEDSLVKDYVSSDAEYLHAAYAPDNVDILTRAPFAGVPIENLPLSDFLEILQFGSFQRLLRFFYSVSAPALYGRPAAPFERDLDALRHIRNAAAHNTGLISRLSQAEPFRRNLRLLSLLGRRGIRHKTLSTNMAKPVIHDLMSLVWLYRSLLPPPRTDRLRQQFSAFLEERCTAHGAYYEKSPTLLSAHQFLLQGIPALLSEASSPEL